MQEKDVNESIRIGKEGMKLPLFTDCVIIYLYYLEIIYG